MGDREEDIDTYIYTTNIKSTFHHLARRCPDAVQGKRVLWDLDARMCRSVEQRPANFGLSERRTHIQVSRLYGGDWARRWWVKGCDELISVGGESKVV